MSQVADQGLVAPFERRLETGVNRLARLQKWNVNGLRTDAPLNLFNQRRVRAHRLLSRPQVYQ